MPPSLTFHSLLLYLTVACILDATSPATVGTLYGRYAGNECVGEPLSSLPSDGFPSLCAVACLGVEGCTGFTHILGSDKVCKLVATDGQMTPLLNADCYLNVGVSRPTGIPVVAGTGTPAVEVTLSPAVESTGTPVVDSTGTPAVEGTLSPATAITASAPTGFPGYLCTSPNPCSDPANTGFYFSHHSDPAKYIQCAYTTCYEMPCAGGMVWQQITTTAGSCVPA